MIVQQLLLALHRRETPSIKSLLEELDDPNTRLDRFLHSSLHIAVILGDQDLAKFLITECNVEPDLPDLNGWTPLSFLAIQGDPAKNSLAKSLVYHGADPSTSFPESNFESPLDFSQDKKLSNPLLFAFFSEVATQTRWKQRKLACFLKQKLPTTRLV